MAQNNTRDIVLNILMDIETHGTFSNIAIGKALRQIQFSEKNERAFVTRLAEGVVETRITLDYVIDGVSKKKCADCKPLIRCILRMGAYQILYMNSVPDSAACNESVKLAKKHGFASLSGFCNGVLRNISRNKDSLIYPDENDDIVRAYSVRYSMPEWLVTKLKRDYPDYWKNIIEAGFEDRATAIRVNIQKISRDEQKKLIAEAGIEVSDGLYAENALRISGYDFIRKVPGYKQGYFTVQDESSMCAVRAAGIKENDIVVDVCAAPGGKTTAAAEYLNNTGHIYSMDISEDKLSLIEENVERLGFTNVEISAHDAVIPLELEADVVICDVPCSGLGIIGRKNDIKYRITQESIDELRELQKRIFSVAATYVKPGGTLLYSTCTINPDENRKNVDEFLEEHKTFRLVEDRLFLQGVDKCDGFYYAVLRC